MLTAAEKQALALRTNDRAVWVAETYPKGTRVRNPGTGITGTVKRHHPKADPVGGHLVILWDELPEGSKSRTTSITAAFGNLEII